MHAKQAVDAFFDRGGGEPSCVVWLAEKNASEGDGRAGDMAEERVVLLVWHQAMAELVSSQGNIKKDKSWGLEVGLISAERDIC